MEKPLVNGCACGGYGYGSFETNGKPTLQIQREDGCECLSHRAGRVSSDSDAREAFAIDLQTGALHARLIARTLLETACVACEIDAANVAKALVDSMNGWEALTASMDSGQLKRAMDASGITYQAVKDVVRSVTGPAPTVQDEIAQAFHAPSVDDIGDETETAVAVNEITGERRTVVVSLQHVRAVVMSDEHAECSGPCECGPLEPDAVCSNGWPTTNSLVGC